MGVKYAGKKAAFLLLCLSVCLSLASCGAKGNAEKKTSPAKVEKKDARSGEDAKWSEAYEMEETEVVSNDVFSFRIQKAGIDTNGDFSMEVVCENKSSQLLEASLQECYLNGYFMYDSTYWNGEIQAGESEEATISFSGKELELAGITSVDELVFDIYARAGDTAVEGCEGLAVYPTGMAKEEVVIPDPKKSDNYIELRSDSECVLAFLGMEKADGKELFSDVYYFYIQNNTSETSHFELSQVSINGVSLWEMDLGNSVKGQCRMICSVPGNADLEEIQSAGEIQEISVHFGSSSTQGTDRDLTWVRE